MSPKERLFKFIADLDVTVETELREDTPLVTSGIFDSLALFHLAEWIENEIGSPIDPTSFDIRKEWNTISDILNFVDQWTHNQRDQTI